MSNPTQRVAVSAFIFHQGKALIAQRAADEPFLSHHWENVGGGVEWGELPDAALLREVKEESGLVVKPRRVYLVHHYLREDQALQIVELCYWCGVDGPAEVKLSEEHQAFQWITVRDVEQVEPMTDEMRNVIRQGFKIANG